MIGKGPHFNPGVAQQLILADSGMVYGPETSKFATLITLLARLENDTEGGVECLKHFVFRAKT